MPYILSNMLHSSAQKGVVHVCQANIWNYTVALGLNSLSEKPKKLKKTKQKNTTQLNKSGIRAQSSR